MLVILSKDKLESNKFVFLVLPSMMGLEGGTAGEPSQRASQTEHFPTGDMYLKISEPILLTGSVGGIPPKPPFRPPRPKAEAKSLPRRKLAFLRGLFGGLRLAQRGDDFKFFSC
jgi:hypothetical protein